MIDNLLWNSVQTNLLHLRVLHPLEILIRDPSSISESSHLLVDELDLIIVVRSSIIRSSIAKIVHEMPWTNQSDDFNLAPFDEDTTNCRVGKKGGEKIIFLSYSKKKRKENKHTLPNLMYCRVPPIKTLPHKICDKKMNYILIAEHKKLEKKSLIYESFPSNDRLGKKWKKQKKLNLDQSARRIFLPQQINEFLIWKYE